MDEGIDNKEEEIGNFLHDQDKKPNKARLDQNRGGIKQEPDMPRPGHSGEALHQQPGIKREPKAPVSRSSRVKRKSESAANKSRIPEFRMTGIQQGPRNEEHLRFRAEEQQSDDVRKAKKRKKFCGIE